MNTILSLKGNLSREKIGTNLVKNISNLAQSTERLSTGLRINSSADDSSGLAVRELMRANIAATNQGIRNAMDAVSMLQSIDGALSIIDEKLIRMKELAEQAATGTYSSIQRLIIDSEFQLMGSEINRIVMANELNKINLLHKIHENNHTEDSNTKTDILFDEANYVTSDFKNLNLLSEGTYDFVITNSRYAYFEGTNYALSQNALITYANDGQIDITNIELFFDGTKWNYKNGRYLTPEEYDSLRSSCQLSPGDYSDFYSSRQITIVYDESENPSRAKAMVLECLLYDKDGNFIIDQNVIKGLTTSYNLNNIAMNDRSDGKPGQTFNMNSGIGNIEYDEINDKLTINLLNDNIIIRENASKTPVIKFSMTVSKQANTFNSQQNNLLNFNKNNADSFIVHFGAGNDKNSDFYTIEKKEATLAEFNLENVQINTQNDAQKALSIINQTIESKDTIRNYYGTMQNRLENTIAYLQTRSVNLKNAESRISDADIVTEMTDFVRNQILVRSGTAMLAQANSFDQYVIRLLQ